MGEHTLFPACCSTLLSSHRLEEELDVFADGGELQCERRIEEEKQERRDRVVGR